MGAAATGSVSSGDLRGAVEARLAKLVPCPVGMQVSCGDHPEVSQAGVLGETTAPDWADPVGVVSPEGNRVSGRALYTRSYPFVSGAFLQIQCGVHVGVFEREEGSPHSSGVGARATDDRVALLGRGDCVSTVGLAEAQVRQYIREQEEIEQRQGELQFD